MTYEYRCKCGHQFEVQQSIHSKNIATCPSCGRETKHRLISQIGGIVFKGSFPGKDIARKEENRG